MFTKHALPRHRICCLGLALACGSMATHANTFVSNCNDTGDGSLRDAVAKAADGDTVDLTGLTCSTISLHTGAIVVSQPSLSILGPGAANLTISGKYGDRTLFHRNTGTLSITGVGIEAGYYYLKSTTPLFRNVSGGCIDSAGSAVLDHVTVAHCRVGTNDGIAFGAGVYANGALTLRNSRVSESTATSVNNHAHGGGIAAFRGLYMSNSTIAGNHVTGSYRLSDYNSGGGAYVHGNAFVVGSTLSGNTCNDSAGGIAVAAATGGYSYAFFLFNSTISGNHADVTFGAAAANVKTVIEDSTIAFNTSGYSSAGLMVNAADANVIVSLSGVLASNNFSGPNQEELDFMTDAPLQAGAPNLVRAPGLEMPGVNLLGFCPLLDTLRDNGGPTQTHALLSRSPAIDAGPATAPDHFDQRGAPYVRGSGSGARADIGAFEVQQGDEIFHVAFEGCPPLR